MKNTEQFKESQSADPVIREIARLAGLILSDHSLTETERRRLIRRLEIELQAYKAWKKQYASYFRTPRRREVDGNLHPRKVTKP